MYADGPYREGPLTHRTPTPAGRVALAAVAAIAHLPALTASDMLAIAFTQGVQMPAEADLMDQVDAHPDAHRPTDPTEEAELQALYGEPDADGVYRAVRAARRGY